MSEYLELQVRGQDMPLYVRDPKVAAATTGIPVGKSGHPDDVISGQLVNATDTEVLNRSFEIKRKEVRKCSRAILVTEPNRVLVPV